MSLFPVTVVHESPCARRDRQQHILRIEIAADGTALRRSVEQLGNRSRHAVARKGVGVGPLRTASTPGDPKATASALLRIVDAAEPPLRVFFGDAGLPLIKREYAERIGTWERWNDVSQVSPDVETAPKRYTKAAFDAFSNAVAG